MKLWNQTQVMLEWNLMKYFYLQQSFLKRLLPFYGKTSGLMQPIASCSISQRKRTIRLEAIRIRYFTSPCSTAPQQFRGFHERVTQFKDALTCRLKLDPFFCHDHTVFVLPIYNNTDPIFANILLIFANIFC